MLFVTLFKYIKNVASAFKGCVTDEYHITKKKGAVPRSKRLEPIYFRWQTNHLLFLSRKVLAVVKGLYIIYNPWQITRNLSRKILAVRNQRVNYLEFEWENSLR
ncbi:unnamed protein product [Laminaria digitata]